MHIALPCIQEGEVTEGELQKWVDDHAAHVRLDNLLHVPILAYLALQHEQLADLLGCGRVAFEGEGRRSAGAQSDLLRGHGEHGLHGGEILRQALTRADVLAELLRLSEALCVLILNCEVGPLQLLWAATFVLQHDLLLKVVVRELYA